MLVPLVTLLNLRTWHRLPLVSMPINLSQAQHGDTQLGQHHLHRLHVRGQTCQPNVQPFSHRENLLEVRGDHLCLDPKATVGSDGHAVLPPHGHHGPTVI